MRDIARAVAVPADESSAAPETTEHVTAAGGILSALAASSCCVLPLVFFSLGISGAWIVNLTALAPYQPIFIALTLGFLGFGFYRVYWRSQARCAAGEVCLRPLPNRIVKTTLWLATAIIAVALAFPYLAPLLLNP